jgi:hypothetical protein
MRWYRSSACRISCRLKWILCLFRMLWTSQIWLWLPARVNIISGWLYSSTMLCLPNLEKDKRKVDNSCTYQHLQSSHVKIRGQGYYLCVFRDSRWKVWVQSASVPHEHDWEAKLFRSLHFLGYFLKEVSYVQLWAMKWVKSGKPKGLWH